MIVRKEKEKVKIEGKKKEKKLLYQRNEMIHIIIHVFENLNVVKERIWWINNLKKSNT